MPSCDVVRSLSLPKKRLLTIASREPVAVTSARLFGASSVPTSAWIFNARVTSTGARSIRIEPMYADVYSEMNRQPTRSTALDPGSGGAGGGVVLRGRPGGRGVTPGARHGRHPDLLRASAR
jgi:hypothetical protein